MPGRPQQWRQSAADGAARSGQKYFHDATLARSSPRKRGPSAGFPLSREWAV